MKLIHTFLLLAIVLEASLVLCTPTTAEQLKQATSAKTVREVPQKVPKVRRTIRMREVNPPLSKGVAPEAPSIQVTNEGPSSQIEVKPDISVTSSQGQPQSNEKESATEPPKEVDKEPPAKRVLPSQRRLKGPAEKSRETFDKPTVELEEPLRVKQAPREERIQITPYQYPVEPVRQSVQPLVPVTNENVIKDSGNNARNALSNLANLSNNMIDGVGNNLQSVLHNANNQQLIATDDVNNRKETTISNVGNEDILHIDGVGNKKHTSISNMGNSETGELESRASEVKAAVPAVVQSSLPASNQQPSVQINFNGFPLQQQQVPSQGFNSMIVPVMNNPEVSIVPNSFKTGVKGLLASSGPFVRSASVSHGPQHDPNSNTYALVQQSPLGELSATPIVFRENMLPAPLVMGPRNPPFFAPGPIMPPMVMAPPIPMMIPAPMGPYMGPPMVLMRPPHERFQRTESEDEEEEKKPKDEVKAKKEKKHKKKKPADEVKAEEEEKKKPALEVVVKEEEPVVEVEKEEPQQEKTPTRGEAWLKRIKSLPEVLDSRSVPLNRFAPSLPVFGPAPKEAVPEPVTAIPKPEEIEWETIRVPKRKTKQLL